MCLEDKILLDRNIQNYDAVLKNAVQYENVQAIWKQF